MGRNILLIVEGSVAEQTLFDGIFSQYGFHVTKCQTKMNIDDVGQFERLQYSFDDNNIVVIQGPRNRIHDFLKLYDSSKMEIDRAFSYAYAFFQGIFLIYDVDHNDQDDVTRMFAKFQDESTGMLLLSSPCLEVLGDYNRNREEETYHELKEYKKDLNVHYDGQTMAYIKENFNDIMLFFLDKNRREFQENNIMEHPRLIVDEINKKNLRINFPNKDDSYVIYRYFSTVIYAAIAHANGLAKEIDNYASVETFFKTKKNEELKKSSRQLP